MTQPTEYEQLSYNSPTGAQAGKASTEAIGFFGATPTTRPTSANQAAATTTQTAVATTLTVSTTPYGFVGSTQANDLVTQVNAAKTDINAINVLLTQIRADLVTLGIIHGS